MDGNLDESDWQAMPADVKPETEGNDDDVYEDSQDLDTSQQNQRVMLVRLPDYLMNRLRENADELSGSELGRVFIPSGDPKKFRVLLNSRHESLDPLPKHYDLNVTKEEVRNVFVLREQELKRKIADPNTGKTKRVKKTALIGHAVNDCIMTADPADPHYRFVLEQRRQMELPPSDRQTTLLDNMAGVGGSKYGVTLKQQKESWLKPAQRRQQARQSFEGRAIRMERNELLDLLFRAFEQRSHWTIKQLKERTRQPDVYLRSVLDSIAVQNKRGPYAGRYGLKEEYKTLQNAGVSVENLIQKAPPGPDFDDARNGDMDSESDMEMENVELGK